MRIFITSFWIACKHSSRRLLCLLCIMIVFAGLGGAALSALPEDSAQKIRVGVRDLDNSTLTRMALQTTLSNQGLSQLFQMEFLGPEDSQEGYDLLLTIPEGFLNSILTGENISPILECTAGSPLEAMLVRQMVWAGTEDLTSAQLGVYTVQEMVEYGKGMSDEEYNRLLMEINLLLMKQMIGRRDLLTNQMISATGTLSLPMYYFISLGTLLLFAYAFLFHSVLSSLKSFAQRLEKGRWAVFGAAAFHLFALETLVLLVVSIAGGTLQWIESLLLGGLVSGFSMLVCACFRDSGRCAGLSLLGSLGLGFCGGMFLPLPLMPKIFRVLAPFNPLWQGQRLFQSLLLGQRIEDFQSLLWIVALWCGCGLLWMGKERPL